MYSNIPDSDKQGAPSMKYGVLCICEPLVQTSWSKLRECMFTTTDAVQLVHGGMCTVSRKVTDLI